jgi:hypothetical protein
MQSIVKVGQRFKFTVLTDDAPTERQGVVIRVLSNREEGLVLMLINICRIGLRLTSYQKQSFQLPSSLFVARTGRYISMTKLPTSPYCRDAD